jgi:hypothetical protein
MIILRLVAILFFGLIGFQYLSTVSEAIAGGSLNHLQIGVLVVTVYCLISTLGHEARDNELRKILKELKK